MIDESIFKAYDIRGLYPDALNEDVARQVGRAFVNYLNLSGSRVVVGRDMRLSGEALKEAFIKGVTEAGADVLDIGLVSTDALYFAVGHLEEPGGAMITASHNPKDYNGLKLCREDAIALSGDEGGEDVAGDGDAFAGDDKAPVGVSVEGDPEIRTL